MQVFNDVATGLPAVQHGGDTFLLACLPTKPAVRYSFAGYKSEKGDVEVYNISRRDVFDDLFLLNQKSHGSCVGFALAAALMENRVMSGHTFARLSGAYVYSWINGNRDNGASIGEALGAAIQHGTCLETTVPWNVIYRSQTKVGDTEAQRFKVDEGYRIESYDDALSAIINGFTIVYAVQVGSTFDRLDAEDVVGLDRGPGNHAVHANGIWISQKHGPLLDSRNSWGTWGNNGWFRTGRKHWESLQQDAFAIRASSLDPQDPKQPPVAKP